MRQANLITFKETKHKSGMLLLKVPQLTWLGNDYLDSIVNENVWSKTKNYVKEKGLELSNVPIDVIVEVAKAQMKNWLGL